VLTCKVSCSQKDAPSPLEDMVEMQCLWFLQEEGDSYAAQQDWGRALRRYHQILDVRRPFSLLAFPASRARGLTQGMPCSPADLPGHRGGPVRLPLVLRAQVHAQGLHRVRLDLSLCLLVRGGALTSRRSLAQAPPLRGPGSRPPSLRRRSQGRRRCASSLSSHPLAALLRTSELTPRRRAQIYCRMHDDPAAFGAAPAPLTNGDKAAEVEEVKQEDGDEGAEEKALSRKEKKKAKGKKKGASAVSLAVSVPRLAELTLPRPALSLQPTPRTTKRRTRRPRRSPSRSTRTRTRSASSTSRTPRRTRSSSPCASSAASRSCTRLTRRRSSSRPRSCSDEVRRARSLLTRRRSTRTIPDVFPFDAQASLSRRSEPCKRRSSCTRPRPPSSPSSSASPSRRRPTRPSRPSSRRASSRSSAAPSRRRSLTRSCRRTARAVRRGSSQRRRPSSPSATARAPRRSSCRSCRARRCRPVSRCVPLSLAHLLRPCMS